MHFYSHPISLPNIFLTSPHQHILSEEPIFKSLEPSVKDGLWIDRQNNLQRIFVHKKQKLLLYLVSTPPLPSMLSVIFHL